MKLALFGSFLCKPFQNESENTFYNCALTERCCAWPQVTGNLVILMFNSWVKIHVKIDDSKFLGEKECGKSFLKETQVLYFCLEKSRQILIRTFVPMLIPHAALQI